MTACEWIIIGTAAVKNPGFLHDACARFAGAHQSWVSTRRDGKVATDGWRQAHRPRRDRPRHEIRGLSASKRIIYTDIGRDGMTAGVNVEATVTAGAGR
jgi:phosphoribosylformimino-5-aminoimidazole carboxamide ribotide isomerase